MADRVFSRAYLRKSTMKAGGMMRASTCLVRLMCAGEWRHSILPSAAAAMLLCSVPSGVAAHHSGHRLTVPSTKCGFIDGEDLRDRRHLTDFCARSVSTDVQIRSASATRERLWIEAPSDVVVSLREDPRTTAALLRQWLEQWKRTTGYRTATVVLTRGHAAVASIRTTMGDDVVIVNP